jgi:hypothetical protein
VAESAAVFTDPTGLVGFSAAAGVAARLLAGKLLTAGDARRCAAVRDLREPTLDPVEQPRVVAEVFAGAGGRGELVLDASVKRRQLGHVERAGGESDAAPGHGREN